MPEGTPAQVETPEVTEQQPQVETPVSAAPAIDVDALRADLTEQITGELAKKQEREASLAKLSAAERASVELDERTAALDARQAELDHAQAVNEATTEMASRGLPAEFAGMVVGNSSAETLDNIKNFETKFNEAVNTAVKDKLSTETPKTSATQVGSGSGRDGMGLAELARKVHIRATKH